MRQSPRRLLEALRAVWFCGGRLRTWRGGSWNNNQNNARVRERNRNNPDNSNNNSGFRVCASHGLWVWPEMSRG